VVGRNRFRGSADTPDEQIRGRTQSPILQRKYRDGSGLDAQIDGEDLHCGDLCVEYAYHRNRDHRDVVPARQLKSSFVFTGSKLARFNFVGDSILGADVNLEAGSIICNYRNERADKEVLVRIGKALRKTGSEKFGAVVGDHSRIGANAVVAPGALLAASSVVPRASLRDEEASGEFGA